MATRHRWRCRQAAVRGYVQGQRVSARIDPTAIVEDGVEIGPETSVWSHVHIRGPAKIGAQCIIGEKTYVAYDVEIGDRVKINAFVYICTDVRIEEGVMVSAGTVFTNDRFPRAALPDLSTLRPSAPATCFTTGASSIATSNRCMASGWGMSESDS